MVADALAPYVPTLLALGHSDEEIAAFTTELASTLAEVSPVLIFLDGDAGTALARAAEREGPQWLDRYLAKLDRYQVRPQVRDVASAAGYLQRERAATLAAAHRMAWPLITVSGATELPATHVLAIAHQGLLPWLARLREGKG